MSIQSVKLEDINTTALISIRDAANRLKTMAEVAWNEHYHNRQTSNEQNEQWAQLFRAAYNRALFSNLQKTAEALYKQSFEDIHKACATLGIDTQVESGESKALIQLPGGGHINKRINKPSNRVDIAQLKTELLNRGVDLDTINNAISAATTSIAGATYLTVEF